MKYLMVFQLIMIVCALPRAALQLRVMNKHFFAGYYQEEKLCLLTHMLYFVRMATQLTYQMIGTH